ncbi:MAG: tyrosine-type recombinase/integrase [Desulfurococcaceae archaeon TW002]
MGWDKEVDYEYMFSLLSRNIRNVKRKLIKRCYDSVLLVQLRNGARISEAVAAYLQFLSNRGRRQEVFVAKHRDGTRRLIVVPEEVLACHEFASIPVDKLIHRIKNYSIREYGINTHSLRYAFVTFLIEKGVNPVLVAKITQHKNIRHLLTYTQQKAADQLLESLDDFM